MDRPFRAHVLVCTQEKPDRAPCCAATGGKAVLEALQAAAAHAGGDVLVTACGCLGACERGPNVVAYPPGRWYADVKPAEAAAIVAAALAGEAVPGRPDPDAATIRAEVDAHRAKVGRMKEARARAGVMPEDLDAAFRGFMTSRALLTAIELDAFTAVGDGGTAGEIAARLGASPRGTELLLNALVSLGLLSKGGGVFRNAAPADAWLRRGARFDSRGAMRHVVNLWTRWSTLTDAVLAGTAVELKEIAGRGPDWTESFIAAMHRIATFRAPIVAGALDLSGVKRMLDVGGGSGAYAAAFARANPALHATVFDLPTVTPLTRRYLDASGVGDRVSTVDGDLHADPFGEGWDLVLLSAICHMNSADENRAMLRKAFACLGPGGRVVIQDHVLDDDKAGPKSGTLFALNMLVGTRGGGNYSRAEYFGWLGEAGFADPATVALPGPTDLVIATRPG